MPEFKKVLKDYRLKLSDQDCEDLFRAFDSQKTGTINYDDFLRSLIVLFWAKTNRVR